MAKSDKPSDLTLKSRYFVSFLRNVVANPFAGLFHSDWRTVSAMCVVGGSMRRGGRRGWGVIEHPTTLAG